MSQSRQISVSAFKAKALSLFEKVSRENQDIVITKHGKPLAKVIHFTKPQASKVLPGQLKNTLLFEEDIISPLGGSLWNASK